MKSIIMLMILQMTLLSLAGCAERMGPHVGEISNANHDDVGIVGGTPLNLPDEDAERVVLIAGKIKGKSYLCTGVLIAADIVLTAAHCVSEPKNIRIIFGTDPINTGAEQITKLKSFVKHKKYNRKLAVRNDIALLQMVDEKPEDYQIARLPWDAPNATNILKINTVFKVLGYGTSTGLPAKNKKDLRGAGILRSTELSLAKFSAAQDVFFAEQTSGHAVCSGDSGGPALIDANTVVGVVSYNLTDDPTHPELADEDACNYQSVFTHIMQYKTWILNGLKTLRKSVD